MENKEVWYQKKLLIQRQELAQKMMRNAKMNKKNSGHAMDAILQGGDRTGRPG